MLGARSLFSAASLRHLCLPKHGDITQVANQCDMDRRSDGVILAVANIAASSSLNVPARSTVFKRKVFIPS